MEEKNYDKLRLESQLCFPLYACSKEIVRRYKPFLDEVDLTYTQYITMMVLWFNKSVNVKELGKKLYLDSGTLTPVLKKLEVKGYITRERSKEDENLKEKAVEIPNKMRACLDVSQEEMAVMYKLLYKVLEHIEEENRNG